MNSLTSETDISLGVEGGVGDGDGPGERPKIGNSKFPVFPSLLVWKECLLVDCLRLME